LTERVAPGPLVIIGGAEDKEGGSEVLREFVRLAGGARARVLVMAVASEQQAILSNVYTEVFRRLGVEEVRTLGISHRERANSGIAVEAVERATGVFFTGGSQLRITRLLGGTLLDRALHRRHAAGLVLAGTSAGAAMMSSIMITGGPHTASPRVGNVELGPGMEFLPGVLIDQHFEERGRLRRLLVAVAQNPHDLGIGIDEDTAVVVHDGSFEVVGRGTVTVIDAGDLTFTNLNSLERDDLLTICGVKIHILSAGYRFNLEERSPVIPDAPERIAEVVET
jgi:cyanophycinase